MKLCPVICTGIALLLKGYACAATSDKIRIANEDGCEIAYQKITDSTVMVISDTIGKAYWHSGVTNYATCKCATLTIPSSVFYEEKVYKVVAISCDAFWRTTAFRKIIIPASVTSIKPYYVDRPDANPFNNGAVVAEIEVEESNPSYCSYRGMLFSKDRTILYACPPEYQEDTLILPKGIEYLGCRSLTDLNRIKKIITPLTVKKSYGLNFSGCKELSEIIFQDSLQSIDYDNFIQCPNLKTLILGSNVLDFIIPQSQLFSSPMSITIRTKIPPYSGFSIPESFNNSVPNQKENMAQSVLHVPRSCVTQYSLAPGWRLFGSILPIEPPIVTGAENAEVSWVQDFSATGYEWVLYADEARTQQVMTLVFNAFGNITELRLGDGFMHAPAASSMLPAVQNGEADDDDTPQKRYAEYYSFNITGLRPGTTYWYSCRSLADGNVIEEDKGLFSTLSEGGTGTGPGLVLNGQPGNGHNTAPPFKTIENGLLYIHRDNRTYTPCGWKVK